MAHQELAEDASLAELNLARREHWVAQVERHAAARPDQPAIRFRGVTTTWRQFADRIGRLAGTFARRGVGQGDRVAIMTGNCPEFLESVLAANVLGAIAVPLNFRLSGPEAAFLLEDAGAKVLVVDGLCGPSASAALALVSQPPAVVAIGETGAAAAGSTAYEDAIAEAAAPRPGSMSLRTRPR
jgi:fatty-acyl-CoA synthase